MSWETFSCEVICEIGLSTLREGGEGFREGEIRLRRAEWE